MAIYLSSGVYIKELDLSNVPPGLPTSIGAIVGASKKGPTVKPFLITDPTNFVKRYGAPDPKISWMHYAAIAFLSEANQLLVLRVVGSGATYGGVLLQFDTGDSPDSATLTTYVIDDPDLIDFSTAGGASDPAQNLAYFYAEGQGSYSESIRLQVLSNNLTPPVPSGTANTTGGTIAATSVSYLVSAYNKDAESDVSTAVTHTFGSGTTNSETLKWDPIPYATGYKVYGRVGGSEGLIGVVGITEDEDGKIVFTDTGEASIGDVPPDVGDLPATSVFTVNVFDLTENTSLPAESFLCSLTDGLDGNGQQMELESRINPYSKLIRVKSNAVAVDPTPPNLVFLPGVGVNTALMEGGDSGAAVTSSDVAAGWDFFRDPEQFQIQILINGGYADPVVQLAMDSVAHARGDAVCVLDTPSASQEVQPAQDYRNVTLNLNSNRSALYTPDLLVQDVYNSRSLYVPPSGHIAGVYARTDRVADPWFAPAGLNRGQLSVLGVRVRYNQGDRDALAPHQINYVRVFPGAGYAVWEQHTLQANQSALSWVSVRRMLDVMETAISKALLQSVHEPNDDFLRRIIVTLCNDFLQNLKNRRAIQQYLVVSDGTNNPSYLTNIGQLNVSVFVTPTLPAEKIQLEVIITAQGAKFNELIASGALQL